VLGETLVNTGVCLVWKGWTEALAGRQVAEHLELCRKFCLGMRDGSWIVCDQSGEVRLRLDMRFQTGRCRTAVSCAEKLISSLVTSARQHIHTDRRWHNSRRVPDRQPDV